jgi:hypothetical protein
MLALASLGGCKEFFAERPPVCPEGRHVSGNHCCAAGEEWVPARKLCVCLDPARCADGSEAKPRPSNVDAQTERGHPCEGSWKGTLKTTAGHRGPLQVTITALVPGTIDRPHAKSCGNVVERWGGDGACRMHLIRCAANGPMLIAAGSAGESSICEGPVRVAISCADDKANYKHSEEDITIRGELQRTTPAE